MTEGDGVIRGLDVFGGFLSGGRLYLLGEIGVEFERDWIYPLTTSLLEGVEMPVPARPERLLEATYGPGWRVPDPAFQFRTPARTTRAFNDWFRGLSPSAKALGASLRAARRTTQFARPLRCGPSGGREGAQARRPGARRRRRQGVRQSLAGTQRSSGHRLRLRRRGAGWRPRPRPREEEGLALDVRRLNLTEWRSVFGEGARLAHAPVRASRARPARPRRDRRPGPPRIRTMVLDGAARGRHPGR